MERSSAAHAQGFSLSKDLPVKLEKGFTAASVQNFDLSKDLLKKSKEGFIAKVARASRLWRAFLITWAERSGVSGVQASLSGPTLL